MYVHIDRWISVHPSLRSFVQQSLPPSFPPLSLLPSACPYLRLCLPSRHIHSCTSWNSINRIANVIEFYLCHILLSFCLCHFQSRRCGDSGRVGGNVEWNIKYIHIHIYICLALWVAYIYIFIVIYVVHRVVYLSVCPHKCKAFEIQQLKMWMNATHLNKSTRCMEIYLVVISQRYII